MVHQLKIITVMVMTICNLSFFSKENAAIEMCSFLQQDILSGTWKYEKGNETFSVVFWKTADGYKGHYKKTKVNPITNEIEIVYNSDKLIANTTTNWPYAIFAGNISTDNEIGAIVSDNTVFNTPNKGGFIDGYLTVKIINPNCFTTNCSLHAQWTIKKRPGLQHPNGPDFNIPTNIILTKE